MNINLKATGIELTPAISEYVYKKLGTIEKFVDKNPSAVIQVEVGKSTQHHKSGDIFRSEAHIVGGGLDIYAVVEKEDLYASIDELKDEITRELVKMKGRRNALVRKGEQVMKGMMKGFSWGAKRFKGFRKFKEIEDEFRTK